MANGSVKVEWEWSEEVKRNEEGGEAVQPKLERTEGPCVSEWEGDNHAWRTDQEVRSDFLGNLDYLTY